MGWMRRQPKANDSDIVFARIGQAGMLKRFSRIDAERVELQPVSTNPEHEPIEIGPTTDDAEIVGIVVGAIVGIRRSNDAQDLELPAVTPILDNSHQESQSGLRSAAQTEIEWQRRNCAWRPRGAISGAT